MPMHTNTSHYLSLYPSLSSLQFSLLSLPLMGTQVLVEMEEMKTVDRAIESKQQELSGTNTIPIFVSCG